MEEFNGIFRQGQFHLPPILAEERRKYLASRKDGTHGTETFTEESRDKSWSQVKTVFGLIIATVRQQCEETGLDSSSFLRQSKPSGRPPSIPLLKEYFYENCPIFNDEGQRITLSKANMAQTAKFITDCLAHSATELSIFIPDPNPLWREEKEPKQ
jgi:hypothetical protein